MDIKRKARFGPEGRSSIPWNQTWSTPSEKAQGVFRPEPVYLIEAEVNKRIQAGFLSISSVSNLDIEDFPS